MDYSELEVEEVSRRTRSDGTVEVLYMPVDYDRYHEPARAPKKSRTFFEWYNTEATPFQKGLCWVGGFIIIQIVKNIVGGFVGSLLGGIVGRHHEEPLISDPLVGYLDDK